LYFTKAVCLLQAAVFVEQLKNKDPMTTLKTTDKMKKSTVRIAWIVMILVFQNNLCFGQDYKWSKGINHQDSSQITAMAMATSGEFYTASFQKEISGRGIIGAYKVGELVLSKLDKTGNLIWRKVIHNSKMRIFDLKLDNQENIIMTGGFLDTLSFKKNHELHATQFYPAAVIAKFDKDGNYIWSKKTAPNTWYPHFGYKLLIKGDTIIEVGLFDKSPSIRTLSLDGDSISQADFNEGVFTLSDLELDSLGNYYIAGTCKRNASIQGDTIVEPNNAGYVTFMAKLDAKFNPIWSRGFPYVTFDYHAEIELFDNKVVMISNDYENGTNRFPVYLQKYYDQEGSLIRKDSISNTSSLSNIGWVTFTSINGSLITCTPVRGKGLVITRTDKNLKDSVICEMNFKSIHPSPKFCVTDSALFFGCSFYNEQAYVNSDSVINSRSKDHAPFNYQQFLVMFRIPSQNQTASVDYIKDKYSFEVFPNPVKSKFQLITPHKMDFQIVDLQGRILLEGKAPKGQSTINMDSLTQPVTKGIYILRLVSNKVSFSKKLIIN
jgi:hypothetical protein